MATVSWHREHRLSSGYTFLGLYFPVSQCSTALLLHSPVSHSPSPRLPHEGKSNSHVISQHGLTTQSTNDLIYNRKEENKYTRLHCSTLKEKAKKHPAFLRHCSFPYGVRETPCYWSINTVCFIQKEEEASLVSSFGKFWEGQEDDLI